MAFPGCTLLLLFLAVLKRSDAEQCESNADFHHDDESSSLLSKSWAVKHTSLHQAQWQDDALKVVYGIFTSPLKKYAAQLEAALDTWGRDVYPQKLLVVGVHGTNSNVTYRRAHRCKDGHVDNDGISCKEATLLSQGYKMGADWIVVVGSDNYVFPRNFERRLRNETSERPQILAIWGCGKGRNFCEDKQTGLCGGGGYAISRGALDLMIGKKPHARKMFILESMLAARTTCGYWSDQVTSCIARRRGVEQVELAGLYAWKVCPKPSNDTLRKWYLDGTWIKKVLLCDFNRTGYEEKIDSQNPAPLTFHYMKPWEMYEVHNMKSDIEAARARESSLDPFLLQLSNVEERAHSVKKPVELTYEQQRLEYIHAMNEMMVAGSNLLD